MEVAIKRNNDIKQYHNVDRFVLNDLAQVVQFDYIEEKDFVKRLALASILYQDIECLWVNNCKIALNRKEY